MRPPGFVLLCGLLSLASPVRSPAADKAWQRVAPSDFLFAALLPEKPTVEDMRQSSFIGDTLSTTYYSNSSDTRITLSVTKVPRAAAWLAPTAVLFATARSRLLESTHSTERSYTPTVREGFKGRALLFESRPPDAAPRNGRAEFFMIGGRLLVVVASHPHTASNHNLQRFYANLRLDLDRCRRGTEIELAEECRVDLAIR